MANTIRKKVIILHDKEDACYLEKLRTHLAYYERKDLIDVWDSTNILPGTVWREERQKALSSAKIAILLVSANFLASSFVEDELPVLLDAHKAEGAIILSVIISSCAFRDTELSEFQAVNDLSMPLNQMSISEQEKLWNDLARYVRNAMLSFNIGEETTSTMNNNQSAATTRLFTHFLYQDDNTIDTLLWQLEDELNISSNTVNKFLWVHKELIRRNSVRQLKNINQTLYDGIQPGQIIEITGKARISQWEETTDKITRIVGLSEAVKKVTGQDYWQNADDKAREAYQGMTSLVTENKPENTIIIVRPLDAPRFQFVAKLEPQYIKCKKEDLKTELTILGTVQRRLTAGETIDVFRLVPDISSLENTNRTSRRRAKKSKNNISPVDDIIKYPAVNIYPIAIYQP